MTKRDLAKHIINRLHSEGHEAYLAGGCVRDQLLQIEPKDFDIATSATPEQVQNCFERTVPVGAQFGVVLVIENKTPFEVATFRSDAAYIDGRRPEQVHFSTLEEDAKRRDFTVNGLYFDVKKDKVIDLVAGQEDLKAKTIRTIGNATDRFLEDHLRMMRAVRFAVQLGFNLDPEIERTISEHAPLIKKVSQERIREEFTKTLTSESPARGIKLLDRLGLLRIFLPEIEVMKGVEQPIQFHPEGDVYVHTLMLLEGLSHAPVELALGCLLHDIAKPATFERAADRIRFHGHDTLGAEMTKKILKRMTYPNHQIQLVSDLVLHHLRFKDAFDMRTSTLKRFFALDRFDLHLELHRLDCLASHKNLEAYAFCQAKIEEFSKEPPPPMRLINGKDLIALGFSPGREMGKILRAVEDAILEGQISSKEEALQFVKANHPVKTE